METLRLDFNHRDSHDRVRIGPAAVERHAALRERRLWPDTRVLVVDADGDSCEGILRADPSQPQGHQLVVELDWRTWRDGGEALPRRPNSRLTHV